MNRLDEWRRDQQEHAAQMLPQEELFTEEVPMTLNRRWCWYIAPAQDPKEHGGFVPSLVREDEPGHRPMTGDPAKLQTPWIWGNTLTEAQEIARQQNERLGITDDDAADIVASSMRKPR